MRFLLVLSLFLITPIVYGEETIPTPKTEVAKVAGPLGDMTNPVKCDMPKGERAYLDRLRDINGNPVKYKRKGSFGVGVNGNVIDGYIVTNGDKEVMVYMDMYFEKYVEKVAVPGFTIVQPTE
jgi:hypothetical protein